MGMSKHVDAVRPPDEKWKAMKKVWDACEAAGIASPAEVMEFFNDEEPDPDGVVVNIENTMAVGEFENEDRWGFVVELDKLPPDVKLVRFWIAH